MSVVGRNRLRVDWFRQRKEPPPVLPHRPPPSLAEPRWGRTYRKGAAAPASPKGEDLPKEVLSRSPKGWTLSTRACGHCDRAAVDTVGPVASVLIIGANRGIGLGLVDVHLADGWEVHAPPATGLRHATTPTWSPTGWRCEMLGSWQRSCPSWPTRWIGSSTTPESCGRRGPS